MTRASKTTKIGKTILGQQLNNEWIGDVGDNNITAGLGNDILRGGGGNDILTGGGGKDTFVFEKSLSDNGVDTITDFTAVQNNGGEADLLDFSLSITTQHINANTISNYVWVMDGKLYLDQSGGGISGGKGEHWANLPGLTGGEMINIRTLHYDGPIKVMEAPPTVDADQAFGYTENRRADSFIGSVNASGKNGIVDYRFWDPVTQTFSNTSPDGYFRIDSKGRIFLTAQGAASYVNDAEDTQAGDPLNSHQYFIQAKDAKGTWSAPVPVMLNERDCSCDTPDQRPVYDITRNGTTDIEVKNGVVGAFDREDWKYVPFEQADAGETLIRIVAPDQLDTGVIDPWGDGTTTIKEAGKALLYIRSDAGGDMLPDVECIRLEAKGEAKVVFSSSSSISNDQLYTPDNFMSSLQKVSVAGSQNGGFGLVSWLSYNSGGANYMSSLKAIDLSAGLGSIMMELRNNIETARDDNNGVYQPSAVAGDNFMQSLETIYAASGANGKVELDLRNSGGADFMKSLTSITALAGSGAAELEIEAVQQRLQDENYQPIGIAGNNENFMASLEVITLRSVGSGVDLEILNELGDNFMGKLSLIDLDSTRSQGLEIINRGGDNFMSSLESIVLDGGTSVLLDIWNEQFVDVMGELRSADDFMSAFQSLTVDTGSATVRLRNGIFYEDDGSQAGLDFMESLQTIDVRGTVGVTFELLSGSQDAATLRSLTSVTLTGGTVDARFSAYMENEAWFDLANISGISNGEQDYFYIWDAGRLDDLNVFAGFDAGGVDDILYLSGFNGTLSDISISAPDTDGNVRITFAESTGYDGSIILIGVWNDFSIDNISI
jgi:hypothetical protein